MKREKLSFKKIFKGQATLEFTFAMVGAVLLLLGLIRVFEWAGLDVIHRRRAHEAILYDPPGCDDASCPLAQIRPEFFTAHHINAMVPSDIFGAQ